MRARRRSIYSFVLGYFLSLVFGVVPAGAIPIVNIQPSSLPPGVGSIFEVSVGISSAVDLYAFQFDIAFDPAVLLAQSVGEGLFLPGGGSTFFLPGSIDKGAGNILFTMGSLVGLTGGVDGSGTLAILEFQLLAKGTSPITLSNVLLFDSTASAIPFSTTDGMISAVPEPTSLLPIGLPCLLLVGFVAKYRNQLSVLT